MGLEPGPQLRDLEDAILRQDLPRADPARTGNVPRYLTSFLGREDELTRVRDLLASHRLVSLVGPGGVGKTRLAVEALAGDDRPGGCWLVDLAPVRDAQHLTASVADALGLGDLAGRELFERIAQWLGVLPALVVLDNCEHLIDAVARFARRLLSAVPHVTILATSRLPLGVSGEVLERLAPLPVPDPRQAGQPELVVTHASAQLFLDRARAIQPDLVADGPALLVVARICVRLDGIPLALEMAAARLRSLALPELARRLDDHLELLRAPEGEAPERHGTLLGAIAWSYDGLPDQQRRCFRRLAVFHGGWTLAAAERVCADEKLALESVVDLVDGLVAASLVEFNPGAGRYRFLETIHDFASRLLEGTGEAEALGRRHALWALDVAEVATSQLFGPDERAAQAVLAAEAGNLRAALEWGLTHEPGLAARLALALGRWWRLRRRVDEADHWLSWALEVQTEDRAMRALLLVRHGWILTQAGRLAPARDRLTQGIALGLETGCDEAVALGRHALAYGYRAEGDHQRARALLAEAVPVWERLQHLPCAVYGLALSMGLLAEMAMLEGRFEEADGRYRRGLEQIKRSGSTDGLITYLHGMAELALATGRLEEGDALAREALPLAEAVGDTLHLGLLHQVLAGVERCRGALGSAGIEAKTSLQILWEVRAVGALADSLELLMGVLLDAGDTEAAGALMAGVERLRSDYGVPRPQHKALAWAHDVKTVRDALGTRVAAVSARSSAQSLNEIYERALALAGSVGNLVAGITPSGAD